MWARLCRLPFRWTLNCDRYELKGSLVEVVREMKAFLVILLVLAAAAGVMAYGRMDVVDTILSRTREATEPAALLASGSALLLIAIAVRRLA